MTENRKIRERVSLVLLGVAVFFLLLEAGMRIGGYIYNSYRTSKPSAWIDSNDVIRILCLGDSFTFGQGAPKGYSYPEQLQEMLDTGSGRKFIVYNGGIPGSSSSQLARELKGNIRKYKPDIIIVMTGANNCSNFLDSNYFLFADSSPALYPRRLDLVLSHARSYKLFKTVLINLYAKMKQKIIFSKQGGAGNASNAAGATDIGQNRDTTHNMDNGLMEEMEKHLELGKSHEKQAKITLAIAELKKAIELVPLDKRPYYMLGYVYLHRCPDLKDNLSLAISAFKKAAEIDPDDELLRVNLFTAYHRADKLDLALEELKIIRGLNPKDEMSRCLLLYGIPHFQDIEVFDRMLRYDLRNVIASAASERVKLILQSYPSSLLNGTLREIAEINGLPFVDNEIIFDNLETSQGYRQEEYFAEDGHCNCGGYRVMATNIYNLLKSELKL